MKKIYHVSEDYIEAVEFVLKRDEIPYECEKDKEYYVVCADLSKEEFEIIKEDAECEMERNSHSSNIPVYSLKTFENEKKLKRLMALNGRTDFQIMGKRQYVIRTVL